MTFRFPDTKRSQRVRLCGMGIACLEVKGGSIGIIDYKSNVVKNDPKDR